MRHPPVVVRAAVTFIVASEVRHDTKAGSSKSMALRVSVAWTDGRVMPLPDVLATHVPAATAWRACFGSPVSATDRIGL
jgi:hypothetical protein